MYLLVSDTSVLIDLERSGLLDEAFQCGWTLVVPDLLYDRELADYNGPHLMKLGLRVLELTDQEVSISQELQTARSTLSLPDCFALVCALRPKHALLSGDGNLRKEASARKAEVFGLLWLFDRMEEAGIEREKLCGGLSALRDHPRCRLPKAEIEIRLERWEKQS